MLLSLSTFRMETLSFTVNFDPIEKGMLAYWRGSQYLSDCLLAPILPLCFCLPQVQGGFFRMLAWKAKLLVKSQEDVGSKTRRRRFNCRRSLVTLKTYL